MLNATNNSSNYVASKLTYSDDTALMIVFSALQIRRGTNVLLDNATATINPGQKVGLVGKNGCGKSTLLSLLKSEISSDAGTVTFPGNWALAWVNQETPALSKAALEYVIDGDREYRQLESELAEANAKGLKL